MMKLNLRTPVPQAQLEVWEMKSALYERVKQLPTAVALPRLLEQAAETVTRLGREDNSGQSILTRP